MERISMAEWKPESVFSKLQRIETRLSELEEEKAPIVAQKRLRENRLTEINTMLSQGILPDNEYQKLKSERGEIVKEKFSFDTRLLVINNEISKLNRDIQVVHLEMRKKTTNAIKDSLEVLRDKYLSFSSDRTRVSSLRAMSATFVEEIQQLLKIIP